MQAQDEFMLEFRKPQHSQSMKTFIDLPYQEFVIRKQFSAYEDGSYWKFSVLWRFQNGYGASLVYGVGTYGVELAVVKFLPSESPEGDEDYDYKLDYKTGITDDVIGYIESVQVLSGYLEQIMALQRNMLLA